MSTTCSDGGSIAPVEEPPLDLRAEGTDWLVFEIDDRAVIRLVEGPVERTLGYRPDEMLGRRPTDFLRGDSLMDTVAIWVELRGHPERTRTSRWRWVRRDGSELWLETSYVHNDLAGTESRFRAVCLDITERMEQEAAVMARQEELRAKTDQVRGLVESFRLLADKVPAPVFRCDAVGNVVFGNGRWAALAGPVDAVSLHEVIAAVDHELLDAQLATALAGQVGVAELRGRDQATTWRLELRASRSSPDAASSLVGSLQDVTAAAGLWRAARHDHLTGLFNRIALEEHLETELRRDPDDILVVFVDLDGFKGVNDTHGHEAGDRVLAEIGLRLRRWVRPGDAVSRFGGDEFVVVCAGMAGTSERVIVDRLAGALDGPVTVNRDDHGAAVDWNIAASFGTARAGPGDDVAAVLERADLAMLAEKRRRRTPPHPDRSS